MTIAVAGGRLAHQVFMGPIAAQTPIATGAAMGDRLREEQTDCRGHGGKVHRRSPRATLVSACPRSQREDKWRGA